MMMRTRLFLFMLIVLEAASFTSYSQEGTKCFDINEINTEQALTGELFAPPAPPDIETYFNKSWLLGDIWLTDGTVVRNKNIRYNGLLDELLWQEPNSNQAILLDKEAILQFHFHDFEGDTMVFFRKVNVLRNILNDSTEIFCQELYHGNLTLLISHSFYLDRQEKIQVGERYYLKDIYIEEPVYYIKYLDNKVSGFKKFSRKSLYTFAPGKKEEIKQYFRENKTWIISTTPEIIRLVQFLGTIIE